MYGGGGGDGGARAMEDERKAKIAQGRSDIDSTFSGFNDNFYNQRAADFTKFATPTFSDQYAKAKNSLAANLARRGLMGGSAAIRGQTDLDKYAGQKQREIADEGLSQANKLRGEVENQRSTITNQLIASGDPSAASASAISGANMLRKPSSFGALGNFFNDWTQTYRANQEARSVDPNVPPMFSFGRPQQNSQYVVN